MNERVLRRFIILMGCLLLFFVIGLPFLKNYLQQEPGDYYTRKGDQELSSGNYADAMKSFDKALEERPDHRGALMGRALVLIQTERYGEAVSELTYLIETLERTLTDDDPTGRGALSAAYANRGVIHDREAATSRPLDRLREVAADRRRRHGRTGDL